MKKSDYRHGDRLTGCDMALRSRIETQIEKALDRAGIQFFVSESHLSESRYYQIVTEDEDASTEIRVANHDDRNGTTASMICWVDGDFVPSKIAKLVVAEAIRIGAKIRKPAKKIKAREIRAWQFIGMSQKGEIELLPGCTRTGTIVATGEVVCWN